MRQKRRAKRLRCCNGLLNNSGTRLLPRTQKLRRRKKETAVYPREEIKSSKGKTGNVGGYAWFVSVGVEDENLEGRAGRKAVKKRVLGRVGKLLCSPKAARAKSRG
jgi:hypothetical protein